MQATILALSAFAAGVGAGFWLARKLRSYSSVDNLTYDCVTHQVGGKVTSIDVPHEVAARVYDGSATPDPAPPDDTTHKRWAEVTTGGKYFSIAPTLPVGGITGTLVTVAVWTGVYSQPTSQEFECSPGWGGPFAEGSVSIPRPGVTGFRPPPMPGFGAEGHEGAGPGAGRRP